MPREFLWHDVYGRLEVLNITRWTTAFYFDIALELVSLFADMLLKANCVQVEL